MKRPALIVSAAAWLALSLACAGPATKKDEAQTPATAGAAKAVDDFVRPAYPHGLPYGKAASLGTAALPRLLELLDTPAEEASWRNVVLTIGAIGGES